MTSPAISVGSSDVFRARRSFVGIIVAKRLSDYQSRLRRQEIDEMKTTLKDQTVLNNCGGCSSCRCSSLTSLLIA